MDSCCEYLLGADRVLKTRLYVFTQTSKPKREPCTSFVRVKIDQARRVFSFFVRALKLNLFLLLAARRTRMHDMASDGIPTYRTVLCVLWVALVDKGCMDVATHKSWTEGVL